MLHRQMRVGDVRLRARPIPNACLSWEKLDGKKVGALVIPALEKSGLFTVDRPLDLRVRRTGDRVRLSTVICHSTVKPFPGGSFVELTAASRAQDLLPPRHHCRVLMDSVALVIVDMAGELCPLVRRRRMSRDQAVMVLAELICEFCGTYARDYVDPKKGEVAFELEPVMTMADLRAYLNEATGLPGIELARAAARLSVDGLASPMEFLMYAALAFPPRMGGLSIKGLRVNDSLDLSKVPQDKLTHKKLTPDFRVGEDPVAIEYNGEEHLKKYRVRKDKERAQDYAKLGITHYPLMIEDVRTVTALEKTLRDIVDLLSPYEGEAFRKRTLHILRNADYHEARRQLLATYLPSR